MNLVRAKPLSEDELQKLRELSPLYEMVKEGIDITKIEWQAH
jgi:cysteine desulfurase